jgi:Na+/H+-translocating membrane pyrophosphatase
MLDACSCITCLPLANSLYPFTDKADLPIVDIANPVVLSGVLLGAMLPFLFAALTMLSVQKAAGAIIIEVRRQFAEIPGLRDGPAEADSDRCVAISTQSSVEEMILPGLYAVLSPITIGILIGPSCLTGLLGTCAGKWCSLSHETVRLIMSLVARSSFSHRRCHFIWNVARIDDGQRWRRLGQLQEVH